MTILAFIIGFIVGGVIVGVAIYKYEEYTLTTMLKQCAALAEEENKLRREREDYVKTRSMLDTIDDIPEYLRDKYHVPEQDSKEELTDDAEPVYI